MNVFSISSTWLNMPLNRWLSILLSGRTSMSGMPENTVVDTKSAFILSKMITIYGLNCTNSDHILQY